MRHLPRLGAVLSGGTLRVGEGMRRPSPREGMSPPTLLVISGAEASAHHHPAPHHTPASSSGLQPAPRAPTMPACCGILIVCWSELFAVWCWIHNWRL